MAQRARFQMIGPLAPAHCLHQSLVETGKSKLLFRKIGKTGLFLSAGIFEKRNRRVFHDLSTLATDLDYQVRGRLEFFALILKEPGQYRE